MRAWRQAFEQAVIRSDQLGAFMLRHRDVEAVIDRMIQFQRERQGPCNVGLPWNDLAEQHTNPLERDSRLIRADLLAPDLLPKNIANFEQQKVGSDQVMPCRDQRARQIVVILDDYPFDGHRSIDDKPHLSRSSRTRIVLSVCLIPFGVMPAILSSMATSSSEGGRRAT